MADNLIGALQLYQRQYKELLAIVRDYEKMSAKLDEAMEIVKASEKKWWVVYKRQIDVALGLVGLVVVFGALVAIMRTGNICTLNTTGPTSLIVQTCKK